ncbi:MAG TPA: recombination mediator RecR [Chloroflexota bacterium]|nr:recombination mediator RecR [Chloroflexota bacterium]
MFAGQPGAGSIAEPVAHLIDQLGKLPGVGPKTAQRLAYFILRQPPEEARLLAEAIVQVKERIVYCGICRNLTEHDPCAICANPGRDQGTICVVEQPLDILALERAHSYHGLYHVLHGALSPMDGIGPGELKIDQFLLRVTTGNIQEVILATNPTMEGDATAMYLTQRLQGQPLKVTRPARGLPMGGDLEFADDLTLRQALEGRREYR